MVNKIKGRYHINNVLKRTIQKMQHIQQSFIGVHNWHIFFARGTWAGLIGARANISRMLESACLSKEKVTTKGRIGYSILSF
jgi:tRNA U38,U39,U40 pseudouridine synthase TruA